MEVLCRRQPLNFVKSSRKVPDILSDFNQIRTC